jgi:hypothetical protein
MRHAKTYAFAAPCLLYITYIYVGCGFAVQPQVLGYAYTVSHSRVYAPLQSSCFVCIGHATAQ